MSQTELSPYEHLRQTQPQFFSAGELLLTANERAAMAGLIAAIESVIALPAWAARVLDWAPDSARQPAAAHGVFYGYDFHLGPDGPRLIEINTNAGGAMLNAVLREARCGAGELARLSADFLAMFRAEWRLVRGDAPLSRIAIVDEGPDGQFLAPEFALFQSLFADAGIAAVIADPAELRWVNGRLEHEGRPVDLVYNRLTDFALTEPASAALRAAWEASAVVLTPHPRAHALYADKRNLLLLSDPAELSALGVSAATQAILLAGIPRTVAVTADGAENFWATRKQWFFKPAAGFGSRAAYRGDKLTKRVFEEICAGGYIAQAIVPPSELSVPVPGESQTMKVDVRCYVYDGAIQLIGARLYQGQTTNFRTPGGGFAPVRDVA